MSLTRRDLLIAGAAGALLPGVSKASEWLPRPEAFRFAFFSDTHVMPQRNLEENRKMFAEIARLAPDLAINGGDVTEAGWRVEVDNYAGLIRDLPFKIRHIAGNHDVRWSPLGPKIFLERFGPLYQSFDHKGVHFVLLDSSVPLEHWGHFESGQLRWLEADLKAVGRDAPVLVFTHHWVGREGIMVDNELALLKILEPYNVKLIFNGHGHSDLLWTWEGIVNTMNKGLYQGSYELVEIDAGQVRLSRRSEAQPELRELRTVPMAPAREKRRVWPVEIRAEAGGVGVSGFQHFRWDDGKFLPIEESRVPTGGLAPGRHRLSLRRGGQDYAVGPTLLVEERTPTIRARWRQKLGGGVMSHLRLVEGVLFVSAMDGSVTAFRERDGKVLWKAKTAGYCHSSPCVAGDLVFVGSSDGRVTAFDRKSGRQRWSFTTDGPVYASPAVATTPRGAVLCVGSGDGRVYGLDAASGALKWRFALPAHNAAFTQSPVATDGNRFYVGAWDNHLYALGADSGELAWKQICCERSFAFSPAIGGPAVSAGKVVVPANGNVLFCFSAATGEPVWQVSSPGDKFGYSGPAIEGDRIVIGCLGDKGEVRCVSLQTGEILWTAETGSVIYDSSPSIADGVVAIGSVNGLVSTFELGSGAPVAKYRLPEGHLFASPASSGRGVYIASFCDEVFALDILPKR